jgi:hypothetical protein
MQNDIKQQFGNNPLMKSTIGGGTNAFQTVNPYIIDAMQQSKKNIKKKSESIDLVRNFIFS